ncbi:hypothetical protein [Salinispira pacifica]|uniref:Uncharacterized protein n=1 Tax=Salinispira pacifica TaxID=1307761 RepID=V5WHH3_9SPIO|nr:hypothetical protein [Salinispira pacifica]AHC15263.1 hypothetical protein L21SP2_1890 [Salinispira pacifica]
MESQCFRCKAPLTITLPVSRNETCASCDADVRVCKNCKFYSPGSHWDCREQIPEEVRDKERNNFCDYFSPRRASPGTGSPEKGGGEDAAAKARDAFNSLFSDDL